MVDGDFYEGLGSNGLKGWDPMALLCPITVWLTIGFSLRSPSLEVERLFIEWFFRKDYCFSKGL